MNASTPMPVCGKWLALLALCLGAAQPAFAQGGPPVRTDDPATPGAGAWEINLAYIEQRTHQERLRNIPYIDFNYGLGESIQLKYETSWLLSDAPDSGGVKSGPDNSLLGLKWRFLDEERSGINMSVYPQLEVENFTGSVSRGLAEPGPNLFLPLEVSRSFGAATLVGEVGYQYLRAGPDEWVVGMLGAMQVSEALEVIAEVRSTAEKFLDGGDVVASVGLRQALNPKLKLTAAVGTGLRNGTDSTTFLAYLGIQIVLGKK